MATTTIPCCPASNLPADPKHHAQSPHEIVHKRHAQNRLSPPPSHRPQSSALQPPPSPPAPTPPTSPAATPTAPMGGPTDSTGGRVDATDVRPSVCSGPPVPASSAPRAAAAAAPLATARTAAAPLPQGSSEKLWAFFALRVAAGAPAAAPLAAAAPVVPPAVPPAAVGVVAVLAPGADAVPAAGAAVGSGGASITRLDTLRPPRDRAARRACSMGKTPDPVWVR